MIAKIADKSTAIDGASAWTRPPTAVRVVEQVLAVICLGLLGMRQFLWQGLTSGVVLGLLLIPLWLAVLRQFRGARTLLGLCVLTLFSGFALAWFSGFDQIVSRGIALNSGNLILGIMVGLGVVLWSRTVLPTSLIGLSYGIGMLASVILFSDESGGNSWKFGYAVPIAVVTLAVVDGPRKRGRQFLVLIGLASTSIVFDSRSYFATFIISALLIVWQWRSGHGPGSWPRTALFFGAMGAAVYYLGTTLLVDGYLGQDAQLRSVQQLDTAGSLILGGRPEFAASMALIRDRVWGFGLGVQPSLHDVTVAKAGMAKLNYDPNNGYVDHFMFGGAFELHSTFGDLWAIAGIVGLIVVLLMGFIVIRAVTMVAAHRTGGGLLLFLASWTLWNLLFSPLYGAAPTLALTLGLALARRDRVGVRSREPKAIRSAKANEMQGS